MASTSIWVVLSLVLLLTPWLSAAELLKDGNFESGITENWKENGCKVGGTTEVHGGKSALLAYYRTAKWNGPGQYLDISLVKPGKQYSFSTYVKLRAYVSLPQPQVLMATLRHTFADGSGDKFQNIAYMADVKMDRWFLLKTQFTVKDYGKPLKSLFLYVEGPIGGVNIMLDDASLTAKGTGSTGSTGNPTKQQTAVEKKIDSIRKGNLTVSISSDKPLNNVEVKFEQLRHEFGFGTAVSADYLQTNAAYRQWCLDNFEWAVIENAMKWKQVEWTRGQSRWGNADGAMKILEDNGKKVRGHAIFWAVNERVPDWVKTINNRDELYNVCMKRATEAVSRYKGRLQHWDVNNEMMAGNFFENKYGSSSIRYDMFKKARQVDPNVKLFLNDYNVISGGSRLLRYINMAKEFQKAGAPLGGIGVQGHFGGRPKGSTVKDRLDQLAKLNLPIWVTELDYVHPNDQERADILEELLTTFFSHPSVDGVLFWGYSDKRHWRGSNAALVNGENMTPNAAGRMWQRLFHQQWRTNVVNKVGNIKQGKRESTWVKAFYGDYKVSVSVGGKVVTSRDVNIRKEKGSEHLNIQLNSDGVIG